MRLCRRGRCICLSWGGFWIEGRGGLVAFHRWIGPGGAQVDFWVFLVASHRWIGPGGAEVDFWVFLVAFHRWMGPGGDWLNRWVFAGVQAGVPPVVLRRSLYVIYSTCLPTYNVTVSPITRSAVSPTHHIRVTPLDRNVTIICSNTTRYKLHEPPRSDDNSTGDTRKIRRPPVLSKQSVRNHGSIPFRIHPPRPSISQPAFPHLFLPLLLILL
jgi:hypothetical protein